VKPHQQAWNNFGHQETGQFSKGLSPAWQKHLTIFFVILFHERFHFSLSQFRILLAQALAQIKSYQQSKKVILFDLHTI
jgi:hypothetical protein